MISGLVRQFLLVEDSVSSVYLFEDRKDKLDGCKDQAKRGLKSEQKARMNKSYEREENKIQEGLLNSFRNEALDIIADPLANAAAEGLFSVHVEEVFKAKI